MVPGVSPDVPLVREVLDEREAELVEQALAVLDSREEPAAAVGARHVREAIARLTALWQAVERFPKTQQRQNLGPRRRDFQTLLDTFVKCEPYTIEAYLPTRATLARAYGMAKFNFARMVRYVIGDCVPADSEGGALRVAADLVERSAAAAIIAEDVLRSVAADNAQPDDLRRRAVTLLADLWDRRATHSLTDFAPLLDSAWRAKARVRISYGTLAGVNELFQLLRNGCDPAFVDYFSSDRATAEHYAAFEEFVFNATHEELTRMRDYMREQNAGVLDAAAVARIFNVNLERLHTTTGTPQDMFFTFREREMWAAQRRLRNLPGPKKTAEEYVMIYVLGRSAGNGVEP